MRKTIGIIIAIFLFAFISILMIIIRNAKQLYKIYKDKNKFNLEQRDRLKCINIMKVENVQIFYNKPYEYFITFENVDNHQIFELYVEEFDAKELYVNDEYIIIHDGVVVFNIYKTFF